MRRGAAVNDLEEGDEDAGVVGDVPPAMEKLQVNLLIIPLKLFRH